MAIRSKFNISGNNGSSNEIVDWTKWKTGQMTREIFVFELDEICRNLVCACKYIRIPTGASILTRQIKRCCIQIHSEFARKVALLIFHNFQFPKFIHIYRLSKPNYDNEIYYSEIPFCINIWIFYCKEFLRKLYDDL